MSSDRTPNVVLIMTDQLRYDALGVNNSAICRTPNLDRLAQQGLQFTNAYTPCGLCTPARASLLTGHYPHNHGLLTNNDMTYALREDLPDRELGLSTLLRDRGWACRYVGKWHVGIHKLPSDYGFSGMDIPGYGRPGNLYDEYLESRSLARPEVVGDVYGPPGRCATLSGPVEGTDDYFLAEYSIQQLQDCAQQYKETGQNFLLWVNFWGPHNPYFCVEPYASMYDPSAIPPWPNFDDTLDDKPILHRRYLEAGLDGSLRGPWERWQPAVAKYWGRVTQMDAQIGRIVQAIDDLGMREDTMVVFTNDHGDSLGQHGGLFDKGPFMYEEVYHIPFIVRWPGQTQPGGISDRFVSLLDVMPTVLDLGHMPIPQDVEGHSMRSLLQGEDAEDWPDYCIAEWHGHRFLYSQRMIRWSHYKYVFNPADIDELYDLETDPYELCNRIRDEELQEVRTHLQDKLMRHLVDSGDPIRKGAWFMIGGKEQQYPDIARPYHLLRHSEQ